MGPKGLHYFGTQGPTFRVQSVKVKDTNLIVIVKHNKAMEIAVMITTTVFASLGKLKLTAL